MSVILDKSRTGGFDEDLILVERFLGGDSDSFESLYTKYFDKVFAIARGILFDVEEATDAVQEIFTLVYRNLHKFDRRAKFSTWLFRIAVNRSIQETRKQKHRPRTTELDEAIAQSIQESPISSDPRVETAMAQLVPQDRAILILFYWEELSLNEIADSIGCNANAAKTRLYRARERFRALYEETE
ncbi:MAG: sigma-70 family RNA polymerase sigma factor [Fimbriimonadaceae bacterium]|nr:sigma-70 family RNA polymerase sigma factor [Fimbriimonadaceae bacterium]